MKSPILPVLCGVALMGMTACNTIQEKAEVQSHDLALKAAVTQLTLAQSDVSLGKRERNKRVDSLAKVMLIEFPPSPPVAKDSAERIIKAQLPPAINGLKLAARNTAYNAPEFDNNALTDRRYANQIYYVGAVAYGNDSKNPKAKSPVIILQIGDEGYEAELAIAVTQSQMIAEADERLKPTNTVLAKTVNQYGQTWMHFLPKAEAIKAGEIDANTSAWMTWWNNRFLVLFFTVGQPENDLDLLEQIIDVDWLNQLKRPIPPKSQ